MDGVTQTETESKTIGTQTDCPGVDEISQVPEKTYRDESFWENYEQDKLKDTREAIKGYKSQAEIYQEELIKTPKQQIIETFMMGEVNTNVKDENESMDQIEKLAELRGSS